MIVQCAACQARFKIADDKVTDRGVKVRCRKCSTIFIVRKDSAPAPDSPPLGRPGDARAAAPGRHFIDPFGQPSPAAPPDISDPFNEVTVARAIPAAALAAAFGAPAPTPAPAPAPATGRAPALRLAAADPFAGLGVGAAPASLAAAPGRAAPSPRRPSDDPFANIDIGALPGPPGPMPGAATNDPFANIDIGTPAPAPRAATPPAADPFASFDLGGLSSAPAPASAPKVAADPFASLDLGGSRKPAPKANAFDDLFSAPPPAPAPAAAAIPTAPPAGPRQPGEDPFAGIDLGHGAPSAASAKITVPAMPAIPAALDLGSIDLGPPEGAEPSNLGEDLEMPTPAVAEVSEPDGPRTLVKKIQWGGGDADKVTVQSPAAAYASQLIKKPETASRPSLIWSLLAALAILGVGGVVLERTARAIMAARGPQVAPTVALVTHDLTSAYYPTREGRAVFVVRGQVDNRSKEPQAPAVKVTVEVRRGSSVERVAEVFAGKPPGLEEIFANSGPLEIAELAQRLNSAAGPLAPGASADFLAIFGEYPDDLSDLTLHAAATTATPPSAPQAKPEAARIEPSAPTADKPGPLKAVQPKVAEPAKGEPAKGAEPARPDPRKGDKPKFEFPMDDPPRPLRIISGQPGGGAH